MTSIDAPALGGVYKLVELERRRERVKEALDRLGLYERRTQLAGKLSGGWKQRMALAASTLHEPQLLLLDEPTAGVGREDAQTFIRLIADLRAEDPDLTVLLTAHDMDVVFGLADHVVLLSLGKVVLDGTPAEVAGAEVTRRVYLGDKHATAVADRMAGRTSTVDIPAEGVRDE